MKYLLEVVAVFLLYFSFSRADLCQNKFVVQNCTNSGAASIDAFVYNLIEQSTSLLCPQTRTINSNSITTVPEWRIISSSSGTFCTETNYSVYEICVIDDSTLLIDQKFFTGVLRGEVNIYFVHNDTTSNMITVRFADFGVYPHMNYTNITATEGDTEVSFAFDIYIEKKKLKNGEVSLYFVKNDTKTDITNMGVVSPNQFVPCTIPDPTLCQCTKDEEVAHVYNVTLPSPTPANDGIYLLEVTIDNRTFSTSISLSVTPLTITSTSTTITSSTSIPPSQTASPSQSPSSSSPSPSPTPLPIVPSPSVQSTNSTSLLPVWIAIGILGGVVVIVAIISIIMLVSFIYYRKKKNRNTPSNDIEDGIPIKNIGNGHGPPPTINPRTNSVSSERPLFSGSATSSNVSTPTTKAPSDYTGVYCDIEHKKIGKMWKEKHGDAICIMENIDDIVVALPNPHCNEILVYAEITDEFSRELLSRGITSDRSKLKWWQFVEKDRTPDNTIEINGFRVIQVEGNPDDFDTHQLGILKSEYPVLRQSTQGTRKQRKYKGLEETDHHRESPQTIHHPLPVQTSTPQAKQDGEVIGLLKETKDLLKEIAGSTKKGADLQKEQLDVNKEVRDLQQEGNEIASAQLAHQEATDVVVEEEKSPEDTVV